MSEEMYRELHLGRLNTTRLPRVVGADGNSLEALGRVICEKSIGNKIFKQTFLVCQNIHRAVILGKDFARDNCTGVHWTKNLMRVLLIDLKPIAETRSKISVSLKQPTKLPSRSCAVVEVDINTTSLDKVQIEPDELC